VYNKWPYKIGNINDLLTFYIGYFKSILKPVFLDPLDNRRSAEEATYIFFLDFLDECQGRSLILFHSEHYYNILIYADGGIVTLEGRTLILEDTLIIILHCS